MPKSIIEQRVEAAWDDVQAAVSDGLAAADVTRLADVVPIVAKKPAAATLSPATMRSAPPGRLRLRVSGQPPTVVDYEFRLAVHYDALAAPNPVQITTWAAAARAVELLDVLDRLAATGLTVERSVEALGDTAPGGWGQVRCVTFTLDAAVGKSLETLKLLGWDAPIPLDVRLPSAPQVDCVLFRKGGGPHVRRDADLTLGWLPAAGSAIDLVLTEQVELVNAGPHTVAAVRLVPG